MKKIKMLIQALRLYKKIGKDLEKKDKRAFTNEQLKDQFEKGKIIKDNLRQISTFLLIVILTLYLIPILVCSIMCELNEYLVLELFTLSSILPLILGITIFKITPTQSNVELISNQMRVNSLLEEKNNGNNNIFIIENKLHVNSFSQMYSLSNMKKVIVDNTHDCITLYFTSDNGYIKVIYPEDTINTLIEKGKITIVDYIKAIETS